MLSENLKILRIQKGLTQEELAVRLNVVRQTVSKWEQGLSVPDSEMLISIADVFEVPVGSLLGEAINPEASQNELQQIAAKLEQLNALLAERNARSRTIMRIIAGCLLAIAAVIILAMLVSLIEWICISRSMSSGGIIGGADGPTAIFVTGESLWPTILIACGIAAAIIIVAVFLLRRGKKR